MVVLFLCIILVLILIVITIVKVSCIKIKLSDFEIKDYESLKNIFNLIIKKEYIRIFDFLDFKLSLVFYAFKKIPLFKYKISDDEIAKFLRKQVKEHKLKKEEKDLEIFAKDDKKQIDKELDKIKIEKLQLKANIGTNNSSSTALITTLSSIAISIILPYITKKEKSKNYDYEINPIYIDNNFFNIKASLIISLPVKGLVNLIK